MNDDKETKTTGGNGTPSVDDDSRRIYSASDGPLRQDNWNYSITNRWKTRHKIFGEYLANDHTSNNLPRPKQLFFNDSDQNGNLIYQDIWGKNNKGSLENMQKELETMHKELENMHKELGTMQKELGTMQKELENIQVGLQPMNDELDELKAGRDQATEKLKQAREELGAINDQAEEKQGIESHQTIVELHQQLIKEREGRIKQCEGKIEERKGKIEESKGKIKKSVGEIVQCEGKIEERKGKIQEREGKIKKSVGEIKHRLKTIVTKHEKTREYLDTMASRGNETAAKTGTNTQMSIDTRRISTQRHVSPSNVTKCPEVDPMNDLIKKVKDKRDKRDKRDQRNKRDELCRFHDYITSIMQNAKVLGRDDNIDKTVQSIFSWNENTEINQEEHFFKPPTEGREEDADQPFLYAVLVKMLHILDHGSALTREQFLTSMGADTGQTNRRVDFVLHKVREHLSTLVPAMLDRAIEVKTCTDNARQKGNSQIFGHCGKRALCSFDFGGIGEDTNVFGIVLTVESVQIIKLILKNVGTADVEAHFQHTGYMDLFKVPSNKNSFLKLAGALCELCPPGKNILDNLSIQDSQENQWRYLGTGGFCHVMGKGADTFMKIPKASYLAKSLEEEAKVLRKLATVTDDRSSDVFPKVMDESEGKLRGVVRGELLDMKVLKLKGIIGKTLHEYKSRAPAVTEIIENVWDALVAAHEKGVVHRDVRPSNIIIKSHNDGNLQVMLSDWGCAYYDGITPENNFVGCVPYAHDDLFRKKKDGSGKPTKDIHRDTFCNTHLDFASLAYTWFSIVKPVEFRKWDSKFDHHSKVHEAQLNERRDAVLEALKSEQCGLATEKVNFLVEVCTTRMKWPFTPETTADTSGDAKLAAAPNVASVPPSKPVETEADGDKKRKAQDPSRDCVSSQAPKRRKN